MHSPINLRFWIHLCSTYVTDTVVHVANRSMYLFCWLNCFSATHFHVVIILSQHTKFPVSLQHYSSHPSSVPFHTTFQSLCSTVHGLIRIAFVMCVTCPSALTAGTSSSSSSSSSIDSTTLSGSRSVQQFYSTPVYPRPSPYNQ